MRIKGKITQWDDAKGFGFIQPMLKGERVFLHMTGLQNRSRRPVVGEVVTYSVAKDAQGRLQAQQVTYAGEKRKLKAAKTASRWPLILILLFAALLIGAVVTVELPLYILMIYVAMSIICYLTYWLDKRKSLAGQWRIQESTLQLMALLGGWPGALLAQSYLRHKSQKRAFLTVFYLAALVNISAVLWLHSQNLLPVQLVVY